MTYQHALVNYLETYRKKHRLTIDAFIEDVTSQRSYYRYIELTQDLPMDVLLAFTSKYNFDLKETPSCPILASRGASESSKRSGINKEGSVILVTFEISFP